jgi:hypothetical protein
MSVASAPPQHASLLPRNQYVAQQIAVLQTERECVSAMAVVVS